MQVQSQVSVCCGGGPATSACLEEVWVSHFREGQESQGGRMCPLQGSLVGLPTATGASWLCTSCATVTYEYSAALEACPSHHSAPAPRQADKHPQTNT